MGHDSRDSDRREKRATSHFDENRTISGGPYEYVRGRRTLSLLRLRDG
jgi:hypothetical protein